VGSNWVHSALRPPIGLLCQPRVIMMMEKLVQRWLSGETEVLGENLPQCRFVHHKPHTLPKHKPGAPRLEASDWPLELRHGHIATAEYANCKLETFWKAAVLFNKNTHNTRSNDNNNNESMLCLFTCLNTYKRPITKQSRAKEWNKRTYTNKIQDKT
jgi:hypothetical protein